MKKQLIFLTFIFSLILTTAFSQTVYTTKTGTKYHNSGCKYLSKSKIEISLSDALAKGLGACSVCKPPTNVTSSTSNTQTEPKAKEVQQVATPSTTKTTQSASVQCSANTKAGTRCKRMTKSSNGKCYQHGGN